MNKKGQLGYLSFILIGLVILFVFAIIAIPIADVIDRTINELQKSENFGTSTEANESMQTVKGLATPALDQLIFIILIGIILGLILLAIFSDFDPALIVIIIIFISLLVVIAYLLSQAFVDVTSNELFENKSDDFTLTNAVMGPQLAVIIAVAGVIMLIILFAKKGRVISPV